MSFHPDKSYALTISRNKNPIRQSYKLHDHALEHVDKAKYLGVIIQSDHKWYTHVLNIVNKANSTLGFIRRNLNINSTSLNEQAYKSLVRPSLEYASVVWDPYLAEDINTIEKVQRRAARYVTNRHRNTSSFGDMINHLNWRPLTDRWTDARLTLMYKITNNLVATPKSDRLLPPARQTRNMHSRSYQLPSCRTQIRQSSFFPKTIKNWNNLPESAVESKSIDEFKAAISMVTYKH